MARQMKDSGVEWIGEIPDGWHTIRFKYLHNGMNTGEAIDKEYWTTDDNDRVFYTAGLVPIRTNYASFPDWKYTTERDLLLARNGTPYVYYSQVNACYTDHIIRAIMKDNGNKRFIQYCLQQSIESVVVDTVSIATWSASLWNEQVITWPSELEQRRIADFLDRRCAEIDAVIERTKATIEEYKKLKQAVITEAVTKGVRGERKMKDSGIEWIGEIPEGWIVGQLGKYVSVHNGDRSSNYPMPEELLSEGIPFFTSFDIGEDEVKMNPNGKYLSREKYLSMAGYKTQIGDIVFCLRGSIGKCALNLCYKEGTVASSLMGIRCESVLSKFAFYLLVSNIVAVQNDMLMNGTCAANLSAKNVCKYRITVPPQEEQAEIVAYLDEKCAALDTLIAKKTSLLTELETYKKSLIYEYVTGKKEVQ